MHKKFYRWEIALIAGLLVGVLNLPAHAGEQGVTRWSAPENTVAARYQISLLPFAVGHGSEETVAPELVQTEQEIVIRYYFPELWDRIRAAIGL